MNSVKYSRIVYAWAAPPVAYRVDRDTEPKPYSTRGLNRLHETLTSCRLFPPRYGRKGRNSRVDKNGAKKPRRSGRDVTGRGRGVVDRQYSAGSRTDRTVHDERAVNKKKQIRDAVRES